MHPLREAHIVYAAGVTSFAEGNLVYGTGRNLVLCPKKNNDICGKPQNDIDRTRSNEVVSYGHKHKKGTFVV